MGRRFTIDETIVIATLAIRSELKAFYKRRHLADPMENLTKVPKFTAKKIGDNTNRVLKTKAAETWGFLLYLLHKLGGCMARLGGRPDACTGLARHWST